MSPTAETTLDQALENPAFPWQKRLLRTFLRGEIPEALDLPTGIGKTSVIAIWLVARAWGAKLPRRLVYVVDRRAVVDQATKEAERLRTWVEEGPIKAKLGLTDRKLPVSTLRGEFVDNRQWLADPSAPAIVVGTVDMIGSRLLFEGYGSSRKMRPFYAGLLGHDTLLIIDESHLVPPFERMVRAAFEQADLRPHHPALPPSRLLPLSATGGGYKKPFQLEEDDHEHPIVSKRYHAPKRVELHPLSGSLHDALAARAWELAERGPPADVGARGPNRRILVFTNSRQDAEKTRTALLKIIKAARGRGAKPGVVLFVGGRRVHERGLAEQELKDCGFIAGSARPDDHAFVIATSAGEVGVDLDADDMVADIVPWERMVQRLGRVNRRGEGDALVHLFYEPWVAKENEETPIAESARKLFERLSTDEDGARMASSAELDTLKADFPDEVAQATTRNPLYPALTRPLLDAWSMTSLKQHTGRPEVQPWLRGWLDEDPQTTLVWRRILPPPGAPKSAAKTFFDVAGSHAKERLQVYTWQAVEWLGKRLKRIEKRDKSQEHKLFPDDVQVLHVLDRTQTLEQSFTLGQLRVQLDKWHKKRFLRTINGRTLVLDARFGGLATSGLLDDKNDEPPAVVLPSGDEEGRTIPFRVLERAAAAANREHTELGHWFEIFRTPLRRVADEVTAWLVVDKYKSANPNENARSAGKAQLLDEHHAWTASAADEICRALGLPEQLHRLVVLAARLHDQGKQYVGWQRAFRALPDGPYAKTSGPINVHLLNGYRHEFGSLPYVEADDAFQALPANERDLVLHLVAAHHGNARPNISAEGGPEVPSVLEERQRAVALRFIALQEIWGPWGLAWLETLLRSADQCASRRNNERS